MKKRFFPTLVFLGALASLPAEVSVVNTGVPGDTSGQGLKRLEKQVLVAKPTLTVLFFGMNDAGNPKKHNPPEVLEKNLTEMVKKMKAAKSAVILVNVNPVIESAIYAKATPETLKFLRANGGTNQIIDRMNAVIAKVAVKESVPLYDYHAAMLAADFDPGHPQAVISKDGIHPSNLGLTMMAEGVAKIIKDNGCDPTVVVCHGDSITHRPIYTDTLQKILGGPPASERSFGTQPERRGPTSS